MVEIDVTHIGTPSSSYSEYNLCFKKKSQATEVLDTTDFVRAIESGEEVTFIISKDYYWSDVTNHFVNPLLDAICNIRGEEALELFKWNPRNEDVVKKYKRTRLKSKDPIWTSTTPITIPDVGYELKLDQDWKFNLKNEYRNKLWDFLRSKGYVSLNSQNYQSDKEVTILAGSVLSVDRVYIRKGARDYSSVTFYLKTGGYVTADNITNLKTTSRLRFFANLKEVNQIVCQWNERSFV